MQGVSSLLRLAFDWYVGSYLLTNRQRQIGRRLSLGEILCVRYDYYVEGQVRRADNFFVHGVEPEVVVETILTYGPATDHQIYVVADRPGLPLAYMSLGFSTMTGTNYLMARGLEILPVPADSIVVNQARTAGETLFLNTIEGVDLTLAEDVIDPSMAFYYTMDGRRPVAMVRVARKQAAVGWVSHVYTAPGYRRRGLATAMMAWVLAEQRRAGDRLSLLLATENAHSIYRKMGYLDVAPVLNFVIS
jgi:GNAT superfamily N-acetyltransferase